MSSIPPPVTPPNPTPSDHWYDNHWVQMTVTNVITFTTTFIMMYFFHTTNVPTPTPTPADNGGNTPPVVIQTGGRGWINDPDAVNAALVTIAQQQGMPARFSQVAKGLIEAADDDHSVFNFAAEQKVLGKILPSWDQGPIGTCVSFGWGRGCQDLMLIRIAEKTDGETWPGHQVATEPIYGGSRVEIGKGRAGRGDGSVGAWAAQWVQQYGLLFREKYNGVDLTNYSTSLSKTWGRSGVPKELEGLAKEHPVTTVAQIGNSTELWAALGSAYPVPVCSDVGFEGNPPADGIMPPNGTWGHCMLFRGRFVHPTKGKCVIIQNSWGNYLQKRLKVETKDLGEIELPEGCFGATLATADRMVREGDTFAISSLKGFPKKKLDWGILSSKPAKRIWLDAVFALAP